jgi:hypothetical protein
MTQLVQYKVTQIYMQNSAVVDYFPSPHTPTEGHYDKEFWRAVREKWIELCNIGNGWKGTPFLVQQSPYTKVGTEYRVHSLNHKTVAATYLTLNKDEAQTALFKGPVRTAL